MGNSARNGRIIRGRLVYPLAMSTKRMFVSQGTLDAWLTSGQVDVDGEIMMLSHVGQRFELVTAVHFVNEVAEGGDAQQLIGKVKTLEQIVELGGEHYADSVLLGESAYEVVEGFLGMPVSAEAGADPSSISGHDLATATRMAAGEAPSAELDLLAQFFLGASR